MRYTFSFRTNNGYPFAFNALFKGIYPFYFYGYNIYEIYKYTLKSVSGVQEVLPPPKEYADLKVSITALCKSALPFIEDEKKQEIVSNKTGSANTVSDIMHRFLKSVDYPMDSRDIDINNSKLSGEGEASVSKQTVRYIIADLVKSIGIKRQVAFAMIVSDIITKSLSWGEAASMIYALTNKQITKDNINEVLSRVWKNAALYNRPIGGRLSHINAYRDNSRNISPYRYRGLESVRPIRKYRYRNLEIKISIAKHTPRMIEYGHSEFYSSKNNLFEKVYTGLIQPFYRELIEVSRIKDIYNEDFKKQLTKVIDAGISKTAFDEGFEYKGEEAYLKYLMGVLISNKKEIMGKDFGGAEDNRQEEIYTKEILNAWRNYLEGYANKHKGAYTLADTYIKRHKTVQAQSPIRKHKTKNTYTIVGTRKYKRNYVTAHASAFKHKYKDLRFYKRWRYRTGEAHDKIWLNPQKQDFLRFRENEVTVEAKISFKAMLDFILFVEQILYVNRNHFSACIPVHAVERFISILDEWITEARPENEVSEEYSYLVRWCIWFAEGKLSKYRDNLELIGYQVLEEIKNDMVNYFESRWGKRVVEYGEDGMFIYSKDHSYINRLRGKKHGSNRRSWNGDMKREYGISEDELIWDVENERRI